MSDRSVSVQLKADVSSFIAGMEKAKLATRDLAQNAGKSAKEHSQSWEKTGQGMLLTGGAMAAGVTLAVKAFVDFDASMSQAQAGTMATGASLDALRAAAIDAGAKTSFSATEAADAITAMGKAGVSTKDILGGGLTGALALAAAGQLDVGQASEIAATAMNQFGLEGKDIPHVADLLAAGAGKAMGSVQDLAGALKYTGPVAKGLGISIEETTGVLAMFAQNGILGEQAGTSMRGMLISLSSPSEIAAGAMEDLGLNMYDAQGKFIGMKAAAGELHAKLGPLGDETRNTALKQIFGNEQITAARILYEGGAGAVDTWTTKVNDAGFAAEQAAMLTDNLKGDVERLGGSLSSVLIQSGSGANDMLRAMTTQLQGVIDNYSELPVPMQQGVLALGAVTGAALLTGGALITLVPKAIAAKAALVGMGPAGVVATRALTGLAGAAGVAFIALPLAGAATDALSGYLHQLAPDATEAQRALTEFANKGKASGDSADLINYQFDDLGNTINNLFSAELGHKAGAFLQELDPAHWFSQSSSTDKAIEFFKTLDSGLATMVGSGNAGQAAVLLKRVTDEATAQGYSVKQVTAALPAYTVATTAAGEAEAIAAGKATTATGAKLTGAAASASMAQSEKDLTAAADEAKKAHDALTGAVTGFGSAMLTARGDARGYEAAIDAATEAVKKNGKTLDIGTEKGRNNQSALDGIATSALQMAESNLEAAEANGTLEAASKTVTGQVNKARDAFIASAVSMGMSKGKAAELATQAGLTSPRVQEITNKLIALGNQRPKPKVDVEKEAAAAKIKAIQAQIDGIRGKKVTTSVEKEVAARKIRELQAQIDALKDKNLTIKTTYRVTGVSPQNKAAGGLLTGPGTGTSDSIPVNASNGEFWVNAAATSKNLPLLHAINNGAPGFANGGEVGRTPHYVSAPSRSGSSPVAAPAAIGGNTFNITEVSDPVGTAQSVTRRLAMLAST